MRLKEAIPQKVGEKRKEKKGKKKKAQKDAGLLHHVIPARARDENSLRDGRLDCGQVRIADCGFNKSHKMCVCWL